MPPGGHRWSGSRSRSGWRRWRPHPAARSLPNGAAPGRELPAGQVADLADPTPVELAAPLDGESSPRYNAPKSAISGQCRR
jgi:hypothetical protein